MRRLQPLGLLLLVAWLATALIFAFGASISDFLQH